MRYFSLLLIAIAACFDGIAAIKLPGFFGDNMVLQRDKPIPVWGWAAAGEKITVTFNGQVKQIRTPSNGKWQVYLNAEAAGGPYTLLVAGKNAISLNNILVGEVWICSGQSNMEMNVASSKDAEQEIQAGNFPQIRHIKIPNNVSGIPLDDIATAQWQVASPATVGSFTAVGYFFARKISQELNVPVGIINSSWGGSMVETWISRDSMEGNPIFANAYNNISWADVERAKDERFKNNTRKIELAEGVLAPGVSPEQIGDISYDVKNWKTIKLPGELNANGLAEFDGSIWLRKLVKLDKAATSGKAQLSLSRIDDMDETYVNGKLVGKRNSYDQLRKYDLPANLLQEGLNVIAIRLTDNSGNGGVFGTASDLFLAAGDQVISLSGDWVYRIESFKKDPPNPNSYPSILFNSMINPLIPFAFRGVLWYQGETNSSRAYQYRKSFPLMISDWRSRFKQGDFPFYFVQLASFNATSPHKQGSEWAELREAQTLTLSVPNTGMAVALDLGETNDIHPKNKQDVGARLAAIALNKTYGKQVPFAGPQFTSMQIDGNKILLSFSNAGTYGFNVKDKYGYIKGFEIAGADQQYHFAKAYIENGKIVVYNEEVKTPVAVRYGWANDMPEANVYNKDGFPLVPFRTDNWPGISANEKFTVTY